MSQPPAGGQAVQAGAAQPGPAGPEAAELDSTGPGTKGPADPGSAAAGQAGAGAPGLRAKVARSAARVLPVAVPPAVMVALGLWGLARDSSMGNDEIATRVAALLSLHQLAFLLRHIDAVHGLYYLLMHAWVAVGTSPAALRIPSVIAMALATALVSVLARRLTGSGWTGLCAGLVMALTPVISFYAQTARSYAMVVACVLGSTLALLRALTAEEQAASRPQAERWKLVRTPWLVYGALTVVEGYLNELALLVLAAHAVTLLFARRPRDVLKRWAAVAAGAGVLVAPLALVSALEAAAIGWIPSPGLADLKVLGKDYFGATIPAIAIVAACAVVALLPDRNAGRSDRSAVLPGRSAGLPAGRGSGEPWWRPGRVTLPSVALPLLVLPASLLLLESLVTKPLYVDRYVLYGETGAALLAGAGMYRIGRWLRGASRGWASQGRASWGSALAWVPAAAACAGLFFLQFGAQQGARTPQSRLYDYGGPARYVGANARPGDGVLFFDTFFRKIRLGYPADFTKTTDIGQALTPARAGTFRGTDLPFSAVRPLMLERSRIWVIGYAPSARPPATLPGSVRLLLRQQSLLLEHSFTLVSERHFKGMVVTLWKRI